MERNEIISLSVFIFYIIGFIIHFRMFVRDGDSVCGDGWFKVFVGLYFSLLSWFAVVITWGAKTESQPPKWLIGKK